MSRSKVRSVRLRNLRFKAGASAECTPLDLEVQPMVVLVGPNNSGKSLALGDLEALLTRPTHRLQDQVIGSVLAETPGGQGILEALEPFRTPTDRMNDAVLRYWIPRPVGGALALGVNGPSLASQLPDRDYVLDSGSSDPAEISRWDWTAQHYGQAVTTRLGGRERLSLLDPAPPRAENQSSSRESFVESLFRNLDQLKEARQIVAAATGLFLTVDFTSLTKFYARLSPRPPADDDEEQALSPRAQAFHANARELLDYGDGIVALTGIVCSAVSEHHRVILIDEPEAFLHPPLIRRLASSLSGLAASRRKTIVVATHSADFLLGCVSSGRPFSLVRLTYEQQSATARALSDELVRTLTTNPLLRSTGCLSALFHRAAVVVEGSTDRAFYSEVNERLMAASRGASECVFIEGNGKQSLWPVVRALRSLGVPAAAIVDIDVLKDGGAEWTKVLEAAFIPPALHASLNNQRQGLLNAFHATGKDMKRDGGMALLPLGEQTLFNQLDRTLGEYGVFLVPGGEVESWLKHLGGSGHGPHWLKNVFGSMGSDRADPSYLLPSDRDVWAFIDRIAVWVGDPKRVGVL
jgi:hypothetical protein